MGQFKEIDRENQEIDLFGALDFVFGNPIHEEEDIVVYSGAPRSKETPQPVADVDGKWGAYTNGHIRWLCSVAGCDYFVWGHINQPTSIWHVKGGTIRNRAAKDIRKHKRWMFQKGLGHDPTHRADLWRYIRSAQTYPRYDHEKKEYQRKFLRIDV